MRKHPEIRKLMTAKGDRKVALIGLLLGILHISLAVLTHNYFILARPYRFALGIFFGSWFSSWVFICLHEAAHGLLFGPCYPRLNRLYGILANLFIPIPVFSYFKKHHLDHHKYQGHHITDVEYPTATEVQIFNGHPVTKFLWLHLNPILQQFRSAFGPKAGSFTAENFLNYLLVIAFDLLLVYLGYSELLYYLLFCLLISLGSGLVGAWGLSTHTLFFGKEGTLSYYGWLNPIYLNVGFHMEHHDFPNVPARFLPQIRKIAPEFYENHHYLDSLFTSIFKFVHSDHIGLHSRLKRNPENSSGG